MRQLHIAVSQINSLAGKPRRNLARMHRQIKSARAVGVEAILFAETSLHGYDLSPQTLRMAEEPGGPATGQLLRWAQRYNMAILAGFFERDGEFIYNSHFIALPDGSFLVQRKHNLTETELQGGLTKGPRERTPVYLNGVKCAVVICADSGIEGINEELVQKGFELKFSPTAGGGWAKGGPIPYLHETEMDKTDIRAVYEEYRALTFLPAALLPNEGSFLAFACANAMGFDGRGVRHMGHCIITDRHGVLRAQIPGTNIIEHQQDQMVHAVLSFP